MTKTRQILKRLIEVMKIVEKENKELDMDTYYRWEGLEGDSIHNCKTAACVAGYAALDQECQALYGSESYVRPEYLWDGFNYSALKEYGYNYCIIFDCIFNPYSFERNIDYRRIFPNEKQDFSHLNYDNPEPKDVIGFIKHLDELLSNKELKND